MSVDNVNDRALQTAGDEYEAKYAERMRPAQEGEICSVCLKPFEPGEYIDQMFEIHLDCLDSRAWRYE